MTLDTPPTTDQTLMLPSPVFAPAQPQTAPIVVPALQPSRRSRWWATGVWVERGLLGVAVAIAGVAVVLRFLTESSLWLDETLTVNISRLPIPRLFDALRHDGSPPAYYLLLHFWMKVFGDGDFAVRALAGVISVATLPVAWMVGRSIGGRRLGLAVTVVVATSPFAIRYGTENRMYSLVMFLAMTGAWALIRVLQRATVPRLLLFGAVGGLLLLTHYWAEYFVAVTGAVLLIASVRGARRRHARLALVALAGGCLLFVPWLPDFLFQARHTGTPWSTPASGRMLIEAVGEFAGWETPQGIALFVLYCVAIGLLLLAVLLPCSSPGRRLLEAVGMPSGIPGRRWLGPIAGVCAGTLCLGLVGGQIAGAAFAYRYASVVLPLVTLVVAIGVTGLGLRMAGRLIGASLLAGMAILGMTAGAAESLANRTEAQVVADHIAALARPGDVVAYCPDQLGPAVDRALPGRFTQGNYAGLLKQVTFPRFESPQLIDWVDYAAVNAAAPAPGVFARDLVNTAGPTHQVWLVWEPGYRTFGHNCEELRDALIALRPGFTEPVRSQAGQFYEHESLVRFTPSWSRAAVGSPAVGS